MGPRLSKVQNYFCYSFPPAACCGWTWWASLAVSVSQLWAARTAAWDWPWSSSPSQVRLDLLPDGGWRFCLLVRFGARFQAKTWLRVFLCDTERHPIWQRRLASSVTPPNASSKQEAARRRRQQRQGVQNWTPQSSKDGSYGHWNGSMNVQKCAIKKKSKGKKWK